MNACRHCVLNSAQTFTPITTGDSGQRSKPIPYIKLTDETSEAQGDRSQYSMFTLLPSKNQLCLLPS